VVSFTAKRHGGNAWPEKRKGAEQTRVPSGASRKAGGKAGVCMESGELWLVVAILCGKVVPGR